MEGLGWGVGEEGVRFRWLPEGLQVVKHSGQEGGREGERKRKRKRERKRERGSRREREWEGGAPEEAVKRCGGVERSDARLCQQVGAVLVREVSGAARAAEGTDQRSLFVRARAGREGESERERKGGVR
jgi:hypothetical protein